MEERSRAERDEQFLKTRGSTVVRFGLRDMCLREVQFSKVEAFRVVIDEGRSTFIRRLSLKQQKGLVSGEGKIITREMVVRRAPSFERRLTITLIAGSLGLVILRAKLLMDFSTYFWVPWDISLETSMKAGMEEAKT